MDRASPEERQRSLDEDGKRDLRMIRLSRALFQLLLARQLGHEVEVIDSAIRKVVLSVCGGDSGLEQSPRLQSVMLGDLDAIFPRKFLMDADIAGCGELYAPDGYRIWRWEP